MTQTEKNELAELRAIVERLEGKVDVVHDAFIEFRPLLAKYKAMTTFSFGRKK